MDIETLKALHESYRKSVEAARDETLPEETRAKAGADLIEQRHALDAALIEKEEDHLDEQRAAAVEQREWAAKHIMQPATPGLQLTPQQRGILPVEEMKPFIEQRTNFVKFMLAPPEQRVDMTTVDTTGYIGVYTDPQSWYNSVRMFAIAQSGVLAAGPTVLNTTNGDQINIPKQVTDATALAGAEGAAATVTNTVLGTTPLNQYRLDLQMALSEELFRDTGIDLNAYLRESAARAIAIKQAPYFGDVDVGTGAALVPAAITIGTTLGVTAVSTSAPTIDEVKSLKYSVLPAYRPNGSWIGNSTITLAMALAKDDNGVFIWQPTAAAGEPDRLFGSPWYEDAYFDVSATGNIPLVYGDVRAAYIVRNIGGLEVSFSRDFAFTSFEITMRAAIWFDAATVDTIAVKHLILA